MKKTKIILALVLVVACLTTVFALAACEIQVEETTNMNADDLEGSIALINGFFEDTFADTNHVATATSGDETVLSETVDGTKVRAQSPLTGADQLAMKDGARYLMVYTDTQSYDVIDKTAYDQCHNAWKILIPLLGLSEEDLKEVPEDFTASCSVQGKESGTISEKGTVMNGGTTLTFNASGNGYSYKLVAHSVSGLVRDVEYTASYTGEDDNTRTQAINLTFVYGKASVATPDLSTYTDNAANTGDEDGEGEETTDDTVVIDE
ncbi:MAG: hypothetical protein IJ735_06250 [Clostridia bacterium]|nr:hypothetical protein [Clostridia bacterium]